MLDRKSRQLVFICSFFLLEYVHRIEFDFAMGAAAKCIRRRHIKRFLRARALDSMPTTTTRSPGEIT